MNCKPGDLALVIGPPGVACVGKMVRCLRSFPAGTRAPIPGGGALIRERDGWITDTLLYPPPKYYDCGEFNCASSDRALMPIRPLPGESIEDITERPIKRGSPA